MRKPKSIINRVGDKNNYANLMKKKIKLNSIKVTSFVTEIENENNKETVKGGRIRSNPTCQSGVFCDTQDFELCNFTCNAFCVSRGRCDTFGAFCTAPF